jgi:hypothetical protein
MAQLEEKDLKLHPEYGANPSMGVCFWCGEDDGRVLLLGYNGGAKASPRTIAGYEPCAKCRERFATGVLLIEARKGNPYFDGQTPMDKDADVYPSGTTAVVSDEEVRKIINEPMVNDVIRERRTFVDHEAWTKMLKKEEATDEKTGTTEETA